MLWLVCACLCLGFSVLAQTTTQPPSLMLAQVWRSGLPLQDYWVSEKLDGVRGYWNGHQLVSRGGQQLAAPEWFVRDWPAPPWMASSGPDAAGLAMPSPPRHRPSPTTKPGAR